MTTPAEDIYKLQADLKALERRVDRILAWTYLETPLTSTSWDGDAFSTTAKTLLDLSAVFDVPDNVKAVDVGVKINDSGSAGAGDFFLILGPTDAANAGRRVGCSGLPNDSPSREHMIVPCDLNGDVYYQIAASGAGTMDIVIQIWGYAQ